MTPERLSAEDQIRAEQRSIHEKALAIRRHAFWCKPWEECTCHEVRTLAPRKPYNPDDQLIGPKAKGANGD